MLLRVANSGRCLFMLHEGEYEIRGAICKHTVMREAFPRKARYLRSRGCSWKCIFYAARNVTHRTHCKELKERLRYNTFCLHKYLLLMARSHESNECIRTYNRPKLYIVCIYYIYSCCGINNSFSSTIPSLTLTLNASLYFSFFPVSQANTNKKVHI